MSPTLEPNAYVVCFRWFHAHFKIGDIIVVRHPEYGTIVKRVVETDSGQKFLLAGDNPHSTSSQSLGWIKQDRILGKVIFSI